MKALLQSSPREFGVGEIKIKDYGKIELKAWEMVSLISQHGSQCDLTATEWGFYLGASVNDRMKREGFKVCIVKNRKGKIYINAVEEKQIELFTKYLDEQESHVLTWLDEMA